MRCRQAMHCAISISQSSLAKFSERQGRRQLKAAYLRRQSHGMAQHAQNERSNPSALTQRERPALTLSGSRSSFGRLLAPLVMRTAGALDMSITSLMNSAAQFLAQFFPLFLLGALFGKLNGRHRLDRRHYSLHDRATWSSASDAGSRTGWRLGDVWRGVAFFVLAPIAIALEREQHLFSVCLAMKPVGEPDAGNPHVRFDNDGLPRKRNG